MWVGKDRNQTRNDLHDHIANQKWLPACINGHLDVALCGLCGGAEKRRKAGSFQDSSPEHHKHTQKHTPTHGLAM